MYPESCHCGLPDHGPVDWSRGLTSLDWPRGLAVSRGWFRCLSPWNHMTTELDGLVYWCICASLGLEELIVAIQRSTRRNDDVGVTWKRRNFNVMVVITLLIITLLFLLCYVSLHYTIGKVNVYYPQLWAWLFDIDPTWVLNDVCRYI